MAEDPRVQNLTPEDVARALLFAVESDFLTGAVLTIDGGRLLL